MKREKVNIGKCVLCDLLTTARFHEIISVIWGVNKKKRSTGENCNVIFAFQMRAAREK